MAAGSSSALALAARLRAMDDQALASLIGERSIRTAGLHDWFDLAEALLDRASIQTALERLDRPALALLAAAAELAIDGSAPTAAQIAERTASTEREIVARAHPVVDLGLLAEESGRYAPWDSVIDQLSSWPSFGLPSTTELLWASPPPTLVAVTDLDGEVIDRLAGENAFANTGRVTELVLELRREPARRLAKGGIALPEVRRVAAAAAVDADDVLELLDLAERAGLVADEGAVLAATVDGVTWLDGSAPERWGVLVGAWLTRLAPDIRNLLRERVGAVWNDALLDFLRWYYPADAEGIRARFESAAREASLLGLTTDATPSTPGRALLTSGVADAVEAITALFPPDVSQVYLQHDLSIISPGPLAAPLDARLRGMADAETRGLASTYRITPGSISRALTAGETAESIREFLIGISLTGLPQPVDYLVRDTADRFGSLRVGSLPADSGPQRSYVRADDRALIGQLIVDQSLQTLGLMLSGHDRAVSRFDATVLYWSLVDARYPAVFEEPDGIIHAPNRRAPATSAAAAARDPARELVTRLRGGGEVAVEVSGEAWIARQLELAAKGKATVIVTVRMPDGTAVDFRLEPASVAGGRLRARDSRADLERTLPLSSITAVTPLK